MRALLLLACLLTLTAFPLRADEPPKGRIVYSRKAGDRFLLHVMNADGTGDREVPGQAAAVNVYPTWSPNGRRLLFMAGPELSGREFRISILGADGSGAAAVEAPDATNRRPCWSPDGKQVAFSSGGTREPTVYAADLATGMLRSFTAPGVGGTTPFWKRDGSAVGYTRLVPGQSRSALVFSRAEGTGTETLMESDRYLQAGADALSSDGKRLLYLVIDYQTQTARLRWWDFDNKVEHHVGEPIPVELTDYLSFPTAAWSPDGRWILLSMPAERGWGLFILRPDGTLRTRRTPEGADCRGGSWTSD